MVLNSIPCVGTLNLMDAGRQLRVARQRAGLSLRQLAERAETSHSALAAYESGRTVPNVDTFDRVLRSAGFDVGVVLAPRPDGGDSRARGRELIDVLELAEMFPARHSSTLDAPCFPDRRRGVA
jgi:transcriptional regulator with XRE-family HTH domain